ncbi:MAG: carbohydrate transporter permease [Paenibacillaceae bacterium]|nr:carbohydrate transporter permease [Paenibacillaceae bacterium]
MTGKSSFNISTAVIHLIFICISALILIPFLLIVSISISNEQSLMEHGYRLIPEKFDFQAYRLIFEAPQQLLRAYGVTITVTVIGSICGLLLVSMLAYTMSRRDFPYRSQLAFYVLFTMLFGGGLVPFYILVTQYLHLKDTVWALIVPYLVNPFYVLVMKGFMDQVAAEIIESAKMDGSGEWRTFFMIILPVCRPALATIGLFLCFGYWNDWWLGLLFIDSQHLVPLQLLLYRIMNTIDFITNNMALLNVKVDMEQFPSLSTRMAMTLLAIGPMLLVFPFFQKHFVKGLTIGSVKG